MKNLKNNIVAAIVAVATIAGFSAFKAAEKLEQPSVYWFEYDGTTIGNHIPPANLNSLCPLTSEVENCAVALSPSDVDTSGSTPQPNPGVDAEEDNIGMRFKRE